MVLTTMLLGAGLACSQPSLAQAPAPAPPAAAPSASPSASPDTVETSPTFYIPFLTGQRALGFSPDYRLFEKVRNDIREEAFENTTDQELMQGADNEVRILLTQAQVKTDALDHIKVNDRLPMAIEDAYGKKVNKDLLWFAMVRGELAALQDPYSVLMIPDDYRHMMDGMQERAFGGIGIYIELDKTNNNRLTVVEPMEGTTAYEAGIQASDAILAIDGKSTDGMALDAAAAMLRGPVGSKVTLTVVHKGNAASQDVAVPRAQIRPVSVNSKMLPDHIGYVRLRLFGEQTGAELQDALHRLRDDGMQALILDLRNNGGGYINTAVDVCSNFVPAGSLIVSVEQRNQRPEEYRAHMVDAQQTAAGHAPMPMVLLVNNYSASASEITAGCLKDLGVATLVGVKTFGKGSVQNVMRLPDGAALKLTIAHFFSPKHNPIHHIGIEPNVDVPMETRLVGRAGDVQLEKAIEVLHGNMNAMK